jgi:hypothetical protein
MSHYFAKKKEISNKQKNILFVSYFLYLSFFLDSTDSNTTSSSTLHVPGSSQRSNTPNSTISTLTFLPTAPLLTTDPRHPNYSIKTEAGKIKKTKLDRVYFIFQIVNQLTLSSPHGSTASMQNLPPSTNTGTVSSGIVPPPVPSQQPLHMQSTTPSVANGKDEMRGWLYKWTNVKKKSFFQFNEKLFVFLIIILVLKRLSKTLVCFTSWHTFILSFSR